MVGRFKLGLFWASCLLSAGSLYADGPHAGYPNNPYAMSGMPGHPGQVMPANYQAMPAMGYGPYDSAGAVCPPVTQTGYIDDEVDDWYEPSEFERYLSNAIDGAWFRAEYLNWDFSGPGNTLLGAPIFDNSDPRREFDVFAPGTGTLIGTGRVEDTSRINVDNNNGFRGTFGIPLVAGTVEVSGFVFESSESAFRAKGIPAQETVIEIIEIDDQEIIIETILQSFIATSLLQNGRPSESLLLYDSRFEVSWKTQFWGTEALYVFDPWMPNSDFLVKPLVGFKYFALDEQLKQVGEFDDLRNNNNLNLVSTIDSHTDNDIYGGVIGLRAEIVHKHFAIGVEPKMILGGNRYTASVTTDKLRSAGDPRITTVNEETIFSPVGELALYARGNINDNLSVFFSYSFLHAWRVTRPHKNIHYEDNGPSPIPPGVVVDAETTGFNAKGISVGAEYIFGRK